MADKTFFAKLAELKNKGKEKPKTKTKVIPSVKENKKG